MSPQHFADPPKAGRDEREQILHSGGGASGNLGDLLLAGGTERVEHERAGAIAHVDPVEVKAELTTALPFAAGRSCRAQTARLLPLCHYLADITRRPIAADKPVTGGGVFEHESGIHIHGLLKDAATYQPFAPEAVGRGPATFVVGKFAGSTGLHYLLAAAGVEISRSQAARLLPGIRAAATRKGRALSMPEVLRLCRKSGAVSPAAGRRPAPGSPAQR